MDNNKSTLSLKLYTAAEIADILKMHPQVIARKLQSGEMEGYKLGKDWRVSEAQLMTFLNKHSNKNSPKNQDEKILGTFLKDGKLKSIPSTRNKRLPVLKYLVSLLDPKKVYVEEEINRFLQPYYSDVCTLRREFIMNKLMVRKNGKYKVTQWKMD